MARTTPTYVMNAIREAHARGEKPTVLKSKLRAGTLPGVNAPYPIKDRTSWEHWKRAREEQRQARGAASPKPAGPEISIFDRIHVDIAIQDGADPSDLEALAQATGLKVTVVRQALELEAKRRKEREELARDLRGESRREMATAEDRT